MTEHTSSIQVPTGPRQGPSGIVSALAHRWPTWLALTMSLASMGSGSSDDAVQGFSEALLLLPLLYLIVAAVGRKRASWPVLVVLLATMVALRQQDAVPPAAVLLAVGVGLVIWGAERGHLRRPDVFRIQVVGLVAFGGLALLGLAVDPDLGRYVVAAGWFGHGVWDLVHLRADKVVARSWAEWCAVIDILIAVVLVFRL